MAIVELELNEEVFRQAQRSADASHATLEQWLASTIERSAALPSEDLLLGLFSDAPDLMDSVSESAFTDRENHPLRLTDG